MAANGSFRAYRRSSFVVGSGMNDQQVAVVLPDPDFTFESLISLSSPINAYVAAAHGMQKPNV